MLPLAVQTLHASHSTRYCCLSLHTIRVYRLYLRVLPLSIQTLHASHSTQHCCLSLYTISVYCLASASVASQRTDISCLPLYSVLLPLTLHHQGLPSVSASVASQHTDIACLPLYSALLPLTLLGTVASHSTSSVSTVYIWECWQTSVNAVRAGWECVCLPVLWGLVSCYYSLV